jgi:anti-sigma factor ChrR (cupin superfamily)
MHLTLDYISPMAFEKGLLGNQMAPDDECPCLFALECRLRLSGTAVALLNPFVRF